MVLNIPFKLSTILNDLNHSAAASNPSLSKPHATIFFTMSGINPIKVARAISAMVNSRVWLIIIIIIIIVVIIIKGIPLDKYMKI